MKKLILAALFATTLAAWADDAPILKNGDFTSAVSDWTGDIHTAGSASDDSGSATGAVVKLRDWWTKVTQDFEAKTGRYNLTIKYKVTPDFALSKKREDYNDVGTPLGLTDVTGFNGEVGKWFVMIYDLDAFTISGSNIKPSTDPSVVQTAHASFSFAGTTSSLNKRLFLCFPPGTGTINILSITMTPR